MALTDRVRDLFNRTKKLRELSASVVEHDRLDDGVLSDMADRAKHFRERMYRTPEIDLSDLKDNEGNPIDLSDEERAEAEKYVAWEDLFGDTFRALHTLDGPDLKPGDEVRPSRELNRRLIGSMIASDDFQGLRPDTRHDEIASAFTAINLANGLEEALSDELGEMVLASKRMQDQEQEIDDAQGALDGLRDQVRQQGGSATPEQKQAMKEAAKQKRQAREQLAQQQAQQQQQGLGVDAISKLNEAVQSAREDADLVGALPGTEPGSGQKLSPDQMIELAEKWKANPNMAEIARLVGRMQRDIRYKRTNRVVGGREEIIDVKLGNDLPLLLPHEKVRLRHPLLRRDFMRRFYEESLVQYETQGYAEAGRGPVIMCLDGSGSMGGMPNTWARAVALAFITIARKEKRDSAAVEFSSTGQVKRWDFYAGQPLNPLEVIDFASHQFGGGTDITTGVQSAADMIAKVPEFKSADIVLCTDGQDYFQHDDEELRRDLIARGVRLHGVAIGMDSNAYLEEMCESVVSAWDLAGSNEATDHLAEVIS